MSRWVSTSKAFTMDANDVKKTLRDLGFYLLAALVTALGAWWEGFAKDNSATSWVLLLSPAISAGIAAAITAINRWRRGNPEPTPEPVPDRPDGLTTKPKTQWG